MPAAPGLLQVALIAAIPVGAALLGAVLAAVRPPRALARSCIQHFAAGVIFAVVAVELLPEVRRGHDPLEVGWTFAAGLALMLLIDEVVKRFDRGDGHTGDRGPAAGQLVPIGVDLLLDGVLIGIAMTAGLKQGVLLTLALTLELFSLGLAMAVQFGNARAAVRVLAPTAIACLMIAGAVIGRTLLADASVHTLAGVLSFGCAALLFLVTEELLIEAHESADTALTTTTFFVGFLIFLLLGMLE
jgi:ZIP family zinc transporter